MPGPDGFRYVEIDDCRTSLEKGAVIDPARIPLLFRMTCDLVNRAEEAIDEIAAEAIVRETMGDAQARGAAGATIVPLAPGLRMRAELRFVALSGGDAAAAPGAAFDVEAAYLDYEIID